MCLVEVRFIVVNGCKQNVVNNLIMDKLSVKCDACRRKVNKVVLCDICNWWFHWECANTTISVVDLTEPWFYLMYKQVRSL